VNALGRQRRIRRQTTERSDGIDDYRQSSQLLEFDVGEGKRTVSSITACVYKFCDEAHNDKIFFAKTMLSISMLSVPRGWKSNAHFARAVGEPKVGESG